MQLTPEYGALSLMGIAITWLVAELVRREKAHAKEKAERKELHELHLSDLRVVIKDQKDALARYQDHTEKAAADAIIQERASMVVIASVGDKIANLQSETRQTLNTALALLPKR